jgi:hypothetical protein
MPNIYFEQKALIFVLNALIFCSSPDFLCRSWQLLHHWSGIAFTIA